MDGLMRRTGRTSVTRGQEARSDQRSTGRARALWPWMALCSEAQDVRELPYLSIVFLYEIAPRLLH